MLLGRVVGTVVATRKDLNLVGLRFLLVDELDAGLASTGRLVVAADAVGSGAGEVVLFATGSSVRLTEMTRDRPVDAVIMAIVDTVESGGRPLFVKAQDRSSRSNADPGAGREGP